MEGIFVRAGIVFVVAPIAALFMLSSLRNSVEANNRSLNALLTNLKTDLKLLTTKVDRLARDVAEPVVLPVRAEPTPPRPAPQPLVPDVKVERAEPVLEPKPSEPAPPQGTRIEPIDAGEPVIQPPAEDEEPIRLADPTPPPAQRAAKTFEQLRENREERQHWKPSVQSSVPRHSSIPKDWAGAAKHSSYSPPERQPSRFEVAAAETLKKIWNWFIVGEEFIPAGVSMEYAVASQWLLRIGVLILIVGAGFFLKYSIDHHWLTETARVALSTFTGLALTIAGTRLLGKHYHVFGQGLIGLGLAVLYLSCYGAWSFYHLIESTTAFAAMCCVTALAAGIAVRFNSILVAVLGIVGGYLTPILLSTGEANFPGLFGYLTVLGAGILGVCFWKSWPIVNLLSFVGTYSLYGLAMQKYEPAHFNEVFPFLIGFFVLFSTMTFLYKVANKTRSTMLDLLAIVVNAGVFFEESKRLVTPLYGDMWVGAVTLSLAAFYTLHVLVFMKRKLVDRELLICFIGLASFFLTITMPLMLSRAWITVSWAVEALVLLWIAGAIGSEFLRQVSYLVYGIVLSTLR